MEMDYGGEERRCEEVCVGRGEDGTGKELEGGRTNSAPPPCGLGRTGSISPTLARFLTGARGEEGATKLWAAPKGGEGRGQEEEGRKDSSNPRCS